MGLLDFLNRKDEQAIPEPGTPEFEAAVAGSALPDAQGVSMGEPGWTAPKAAAGTVPPQQTIDLHDSGAREQVLDLLRQNGIDPDKPDQQIDASQVPGLGQAIMGILSQHGVSLGGGGAQIPMAGGATGWVTNDAAGDPLAMVEHLARQRDAGKITGAEFEAQKKRLLGG